LERKLIITRGELLGAIGDCDLKRVMTTNGEIAYDKDVTHRIVRDEALPE
jgi:hypothetical protein